MELNKNIIFVEANKKVNSQQALDKFLKSPTFTMIMDFICALQKSVESKSNLDIPEPDKDSFCYKFSKLIQKLKILLDETPPFEEPQRFGNKAFKLWYEKVEQNYDDLISTIIDKEKHPNLDLELKNYFLDCFGSSKRIDYGTGHELNFLCILIILYCTGYYQEEQFPSMVVHVFFPYIILVRSIQITYKLEPAGAQGVWGLDEYHFLPFLFGSSQLINNNQDILPKAVHNDMLLKQFENQYMYLSCVKYVKQVNFFNLFNRLKKEDHSRNIHRCWIQYLMCLIGIRSQRG